MRAAAIAAALRNGGWSELSGLRGHGSGPAWQPGAGGMCLHSILLDPANPARLFIAISAAGAFRPQGAPTQASLLDALEAALPALRGTIRDHASKRRRPFLRFFACGQDLSHCPPDTPLRASVVEGAEAFLVVGAIAGG